MPCSLVLEQARFALDLKESTPKAMKYRRGAEIIIVIHDGKGDVFDLVEHLQGMRFVEAMHEVASLVGFVPSPPVFVGFFRDRYH